MNVRSKLPSDIVGLTTAAPVIGYPRWAMTGHDRWRLLDD